MRAFLVWRVARFVSVLGFVASVAGTVAAQSGAGPGFAPSPSSVFGGPASVSPSELPPLPSGYRLPIPPAPGDAPRAHSEYPPSPLPLPDSAPYDGGLIPPGYHLEERTQWQLLSAGIVLLAVPYGLGMASAASSKFPNASGWLSVPGLGPWFTLAARNYSQCGNDGQCQSGDRLPPAALVLDGLAQTAGVALLIAGLTTSQTLIARDFAGDLHFTPSAIGCAGYGGFLTGTF